MTTRTMWTGFIVTIALINSCYGNAAVYAENVQPTQAAPHLVTQTVYGFLDFTTTIGNTVMVFSPESAPPPELPKPVTTSQPPTPPPQVIETKPPAIVTSKPDIHPSKPVAKASKPVQSVIRVVAANAPVETTSKPISSKVQIVSSQAEVSDDTKKSLPKSIVRVEAKDGSAVEHLSILPSYVEAVAPSEVYAKSVEEPSAPALSSVVEIHASEELEQIVPVENNLNDPEYEFLSREPSEFAEETYRVQNSKASNSKFHQKSRTVQNNNGGNKKSHHNQAHKNDDTHPTGLVTKLGGTVVKDGATTVHETSVIGTYISGKYAQVLQSTSHVISNNGNKPKIAPSLSLRVLKTAAPHVPKKPHVVESISSKQSVASAQLDSDEVDEIYDSSPKQNLVRSSRRPAPAVSSNTFKNRFRNSRPTLKEEPEYQDISSSVAEHSTQSSTPNYKKTRNNNGNKSASKNNRFNRLSTSNIEAATVSAVFSEPAATPAYVNRRNKSTRNSFKSQGGQQKEAASQSSASNNDGAYSRRFKPKIQPSSPDHSDHSTSSVYKFKLNRQPGRWQYKTSPKPRVTIRKQNNGNEEFPAVLAVTPAYETAALQAEENVGVDNEQNIPIPTADARSDEGDLDSSGSVSGNVLNEAEHSNHIIENKKLPMETLNVEISTPVDFKDTYYEIATIKSPYTYQAGSQRNTRYVTVTSTFEKTLDPEPTVTPSLNGPLTENILATTAHYDRENNLLDSSIATLPPLILSSGIETPPLETLTETFSTTQTMLKTHILPVLEEGGGNATSYTLTQTYVITRLVTATKTLPPMDAYHFNPSKALKEFNSKLDEAGSELNLELDFGDDNENDDEESQSQHALPDDLDLANIGSTFDISEVDKSNLPEGHLRPKKKISHKIPSEPPQSLQPSASSDSLMPSLSPDQIQQLALLRFLNPAAAAQLPQVITTSKPVVRLETVYESHVIPIFNGVSTSFSTISRPVATVSKTEYEIGTSSLPQLPLPPPPINPLFQQPQQFQITTAPIITQTVVTETQSKILKLTFGAKTAYTTLFSTNVVPTILTTFVTQSVPIVQPTAAAFPGYFPAPYAQFPYVG